MKPSKILLVGLSIILAAMTGGEVYAQMSSTNYEIRNDSVNAGGSDTSSSASYQIRDTTSSSASQDATSSSYGLDSGFRSGIFDPVVDFNVFIQDISSQVAATSLTSETVYVSSSAAISVGDMIALVQDEGSAQVSAIGSVVAVGTAPDLVTVDYWTDGGVAPSIDGTNDAVYVLDGTSIGFGVLDTAAMSLGIIAWETSTDVDDGYGVYAVTTAGLSAGGDTIPAVSDGAVTIGSSEYGAASSDSSLSGVTFDTEDDGIETGFNLVGSRSSFEFGSRDFLTLKVAISESQPDGVYSQDLVITYVGDY